MKYWKMIKYYLKNHTLFKCLVYKKKIRLVSTIRSEIYPTSFVILIIRVKNGLHNIISNILPRLHHHEYLSHFYHFLT